MPTLSIHRRTAFGPGDRSAVQFCGRPREAEAFLAQIRLINQRKNLACRVVGYLFQHQYKFFSTGDEYHLRPLAQAQVARELDEQQSTICRILKGKTLAYTSRLIPLKDLCESKTNVVKRVVERHPDLSDRKIAEILKRNSNAGSAAEPSPTTAREARSPTSPPRPRQRLRPNMREWVSHLLSLLGAEVCQHIAP